MFQNESSGFHSYLRRGLFFEGSLRSPLCMCASRLSYSPLDPCHYGKRIRWLEYGEFRFHSERSISCLVPSLMTGSAVGRRMCCLYSGSTGSLKNIGREQRRWRQRRDRSKTSNGNKGLRYIVRIQPSFLFRR